MPRQLCHFFLQGYCRNGEYCRFEHPIQDKRYGGNRYYEKSKPDEDHLSSDNQLINVLNSPINELIKHIASEITNWKNSHGWPLTCFAYWKESACLPDFKEFSPEELRHEAYEAKQNGSIDEYNRKLSELLSDQRKLQDSYCNISGLNRQKLVNFFEDEKRRVKNIGHTVSKVFPSKISEPTLTAFGSSNNNDSSHKMLFGKIVETTPSGGSSNKWGEWGMGASSTIGNVFSSDTGHDRSDMNIFGSSNVGSFHQSGDLMHGTGLSVDVGHGQDTVNTTTFAQIDSSCLFGKPSTSYNVQSSNETLRVGATEVGATSVSKVSAPESSILDKARTFVYTPLSDVSQPDLEQFKSDRFILGKIPTCPPPRELC